MKQVTIIGNYASHQNSCSGQVIKTKVITNALTEYLGYKNVGVMDTAGKWLFLLRLPYVVLYALISSRQVIMMPAYKGIHIISPLLYLLNLVLRRTLHYVVIGGWLPSYAQRFFLLRFILKRFNHIYVETNGMKQAMEALGFHNIHVMPNCKPLTILTKELLKEQHPPYRLCTFSRVIKEKGIEEAIMAVNSCNQQLGRVVCTLDIYGQVEEKEWFSLLMKNQPDTISYKGIVPFNKSTETIKDYFALLFPTYYKGEAFAGTLIDAMAAGVPTIASDWHANPEIIEEGKTGYLFPAKSTTSLVQILVKIVQQPNLILAMRENCLQHAKDYQPQVVIQELLSNMS